MTIAKLSESPASAPLAMFYCIFSAVMAAGLCYFRHYLGGPGAAVLLVYWFEFVILAATFVLGGRWYLLWFAAALTLLLILGAASALTLYVVGPAGMGTLFVLLVRMKVQRSDPLIFLAGGLAAAVLGALYFLTINGIGYVNVFLPERVLAGLAYPDTLFHTAVSSMLSTYGELASPLNGLTPIHYHAFSHLWFGLAAKGVGLNAVHGYYLGLQILALPLLLLGLSLATASFGTAHRTTAMLVAAPLAILFVFDGFDWMSYLTSESHMVGLGLLLAAIPSLRALADPLDHAPDRPAILALVFAILLSAAKISVGMTWTAAVVYLVLRQRRLSPAGALASLILLLLHAYIAIEFLIPNDNIATTGFEPLHFLRSYPLVAVANFAIVGAAAWFHFRDWRLGADRLWHEAVLLMLLVNILPTLLLRVEGGSAYYFINVATWISIASLSARLAARAARLSPRLSLGACLVAILAMTVLTPQKLHAYGSFKNQRNSLYGRDPAITASGAARNPFDGGALAAARRKSELSVGGQIAVLMRRSDVRPGADMLVAVSPSFQAFWMLTPQCNAAPFLIPAYFGLPLLDGLPPQAEHCALGSYYGYRLYGQEAQSRPLDDISLCRLTAAKGFHHTLVLESATRARQLDCAGIP